MVAQITVSLMLLISTGLFVRTLQEPAVDRPGFDSRDVVDLRIDLSLAGVLRSPPAAAFYDQLLRQVSGLPGVRVGLAGPHRAALPRQRPGSAARPCGSPGRPGSGRAVSARVLRGVARATSAPWRSRCSRGRDFSADDRTGAPRVVIVDEALAASSGPAAIPLGKRVVLGRRSGCWRWWGWPGASASVDRQVARAALLRAARPALRARPGAPGADGPGRSAAAGRPRPRDPSASSTPPGGPGEPLRPTRSRRRWPSPGSSPGCSAASAWWRCWSPRSGSTAPCRTRSAAAPASWASAWPWAPGPPRSSPWCSGGGSPSPSSASSSGSVAASWTTSVFSSLLFGVTPTDPRGLHLRRPPPGPGGARRQLAARLLGHPGRSRWPSSVTNSLTIRC